jgi:hypothetical protein
MEGLGEAGAAGPPEAARRRTIAIVTWVLGFFVTIWLLGFSAAVPVTTVLYLKLAAREGWRLSIVLTVLSSAFFYGVFEWVLRVPFPTGQLLVWLGWGA